jgi:hypothetical protein
VVVVVVVEVEVEGEGPASTVSDGSDHSAWSEATSIDSSYSRSMGGATSSAVSQGVAPMGGDAAANSAAVAPSLAVVPAHWWNRHSGQRLRGASQPAKPAGDDASSEQFGHHPDRATTTQQQGGTLPVQSKVVVYIQVTMTVRHCAVALATLPCATGCSCLETRAHVGRWSCVTH